MRTAPIQNLGDYEIQEEIASGGMARVFRAVKTGVGGFRSEVAVKVLHDNLAALKEYRQMFKEEARIGALLRHKNLLYVQEYGEVQGIAYIVTEFFRSVSLEDLVKKTRKVPISEALYILSEAAEGLHALHEAADPDKDKKLGLVHRDISPHNVLLGDDGRVKIIDFGIAKRSDPTEKTRPGVVKGKARYMSPEQAGAGKVDLRSDIYSLGLVFLRLISGGKPHGNGNTVEIMVRARVGVDPEKLLKRAKAPKKVKELARKMLAADPWERLETALDVAKEARKLLSEINATFDAHDFTAWVGDATAKKKRTPKKTAAPPRGGTIRAPVPAGPGIHPKWRFMGLGALFAVALLAHLLNQLFW